VFAATDLSDHLGCEHLSTLNQLEATGAIGRPEIWDPLLDILAERGRLHEQAFLESLKAAARVVVQPDANVTTLDLMRQGADVIFQAPLARDAWQGRADFLIRVDRPSDLGAWSYEVIDTKLASETKAGAVLQLCVYSDLVADLQGIAPALMHVVRPGDGFPRDSYRFAEYVAIYRRVRRHLERQAAGAVLTAPQPTAHCDVCRWRSHCDAQWRAEDHLSLVAGLGRAQRLELESRGISTVASLARLPAPLEWRPARGSAATFEQLIRQAALQVQARDTHSVPYEVLPIVANRGLARLPEPSAGDVFLDLEGDPFIGKDGREYLFGWVTFESGAPVYHARWATTDTEERAAFEELVDFVIARWDADPSTHIYHYAPYEQSALKRLMGKYGTRADELDRLLRGKRLVDLYAVVRHALRAGVESYSIKALEPMIAFQRELRLDDAGQGLRAVRLAFQRGIPEIVDAAHKQIVESYNRDDCIAASALRTWLEARRAEFVVEGPAIERPPLLDGEREPSELRDARAALAEQLRASVPASPADRSPTEQARWLLSHLLEWHRREASVSWWNYFRLAALTDEERLDDPYAIAGLEHVSRKPSQRGNPIDLYRFPPQDTYLQVDDDVHDGEHRSIGTVHVIDPAACTVAIRKRREALKRHPSSVFVSSLVSPKPKDEALIAIARRVEERGFRPEHEADLVRDLLTRALPRGLVAPIRAPGESLQESLSRVALALDGSVLPIQGPPGTGKTHTAALMIVDLIRAGRRVGVTATSHKVIQNLVKRAVQASEKTDQPFRALLKVEEIDESLPRSVQQLTDAAKADKRSRAYPLFGATTWQWARDGMVGAVDVLFIDEAGQMSLADAVAVSRGASSIVLVGDPQQLEQPIQGTHPEGVAVSVLQHVIGDAQMITPERGIFLDETWRLHPAVCAFTSEQFYESALRSAAPTTIQAIDAHAIAAAGTYWLPVEHVGNQNRSHEEAAAVASLARALIAQGATWIDANGTRHPLTPSELIVVAPYNAHVAAIRAALDAHDLRAVPVGTVDKFQGQEGVVAIYSMATSSPDDAPRGLRFLYNRHRLNVATSRGRTAAVIVASPRLLDPTCRTPEHLRLANALCRFADTARSIEGSARDRARSLPVQGTVSSGPANGRAAVPMSSPILDLDVLLKLRVLVARFGEMDLAKWWNTKGQLGKTGALALRRGFPRTHRFAQARSVFAVAAHRCAELFDPPNCVTLWRLPESIEEPFDARWEYWLDNATEWTPFFEQVEVLSGVDLSAMLRAFDVVTDRDLEAYGRLRRSNEGRAVPLPGMFSGTAADVALLALGFARGEPSALAVPYARKADA
jgi:uncharacterized protein